jgi:hypothetical protein
MVLFCIKLELMVLKLEFRGRSLKASRQKIIMKYSKNSTHKRWKKWMGRQNVAGSANQTAKWWTTIIAVEER